MASFIGEYSCKLDAKGRLMLPSDLKRQIDPSALDQFIINRGFEGCLVLYPKNEWEIITAHLEKLNLFVAQNRKFYRQFHNGASVVPLDGSGRILVPKGLKEFGSIDKEVVLFAYANRIEIWSKEKYGKEMEQDADEFARLAEEVMGNTPEEPGD